MQHHVTSYRYDSAGRILRTVECLTDAVDLPDGGHIPQRVTASITLEVALSDPDYPAAKAEADDLAIADIEASLEY